MSSVSSNNTVYVIDTHSLLWYTIGDKKLSRTARAIFEAASRGEVQLVVSSIVVAGLYYIHRKKPIAPDFAAYYRKLESSPAYQFVPFDSAHVLDFDKDSAVTEMHDRIIAGLARRLGVPILTVDPVITAARVADVVW